MISTIITFVVLVCSLFVWLFALVDISRNDFPGANKTVWLLMTLFLPVLGTLLYLLLGRKQRTDPRDSGTSLNLAGIITVPLVAVTIIIYRFLVSQDLP